MCSEFIQRMENYQGDLTDIIRGSGGTSSGGSVGGNTASTYVAALPDWRIPSNPMDYSSSGFEERLIDDFGDPFSSMQDPLLHETSTEFFASPSNNTPNIPNNTSLGGGDTNMFSSMLQISSTVNPSPVSACSSPVVAAASPRLRTTATSMLLSNISPVSASSKGCFVEDAGLQISSPRNTGFKRRKSQAKKVVCIPAPTPANSRQSGEVVPSDLWAWRKYGQKPIKGSPYPRGYYRCSSSKGCSARKQVERSRTDPNMLVITYTSEHNHPWPTQRNALAGSTRSQPPNKTNSNPNTSSSSAQTQNVANSSKDKQREISSSTTEHVPLDHQHVKEEIEDVQKEVEMEDLDFGESYNNPALQVISNQSEDFFAELGEIEGNPLDLLFKQGFSGDDGHENKPLDPFRNWG